MDFGIATIAAITVLAYLIGAIMKAVPVDDKWIPVVCGCSGLALGLVAFYIQMPDMPAADPITAAAIGTVSGFAATGINQVFKQQAKAAFLEAQAEAAAEEFEAGIDE